MRGKRDRERGREKRRSQWEVGTGFWVYIEAEADESLCKRDESQLISSAQHRSYVFPCPTPFPWQTGSAAVLKCYPLSETNTASKRKGWELSNASHL